MAGTRGAFAVLTDEGYDKVVEAAPGHVATVQALVFEGLDDKQVMQLSTLGKALVDQLDRGIAAGTGKLPWRRSRLLRPVRVGRGCSR